jgi:hypothetical protein
MGAHRFCRYGAEAHTPGAWALINIMLAIVSIAALIGIWLG